MFVGREDQTRGTRSGGKMLVGETEMMEFSGSDKADVPERWWACKYGSPFRSKGNN